MDNYFQIFGLPCQFSLDLVLLEEHYTKLLAHNHPDKFAAASAFEQKQAMMMATTINDAYRILHHPLNRAAYLLEKEGIDADNPEKTEFPTDFLMQQMLWREQLMDLRDGNNPEEYQALYNEVQSAYQEIIQKIEYAFNQSDFLQAASLVGQGRFLDKLLIEIKQIKSNH